MLRSARPFDVVLEFARILQQDVSIELAAKDALRQHSLPTRPQPAVSPTPTSSSAAAAGGAEATPRKRNTQHYDPKCRELAEYFAAGESPVLTEEQLDELSQDIQDAIEGFLRVLDSEGQS
jgi:hypothetical protein